MPAPQKTTTVQAIESVKAMQQQQHGHHGLSSLHGGRTLFHLLDLPWSTSPDLWGRRWEVAAKFCVGRVQDRVPLFILEEPVEGEASMVMPLVGGTSAVMQSRQYYGLLEKMHTKVAARQALASIAWSQGVTVEMHPRL